MKRACSTIPAVQLLLYIGRETTLVLCLPLVGPRRVRPILLAQAAADFSFWDTSLITTTHLTEDGLPTYGARTASYRLPSLPRSLTLSLGRSAGVGERYGAGTMVRWRLWRRRSALTPCLSKPPQLLPYSNTSIHMAFRNTSRCCSYAEGPLRPWQRPREHTFRSR
jgi:hypothetical protein